MRRRLRGIAVVLLVGIGSFLLGASAVWSQPARVTGNDYLGLPSLAQTAYVLGFRDGAEVVAVIAEDPTSRDNITKCVESDFTVGQLKAVLDKNLSDYPEARNRDLATLTAEALTPICKNVPGVNMP